MPVTILAILLSAGPSVLAHPDYIPYFNFLAGSRPDKIMADSDLDWGQDVKRVAKRLRQLGAQSASYNQLFPGNLTELYGFPPYRPVEAAGPSPGWNVVGPTPLRIGRFGARLVVEYPKGYEFWPDKLKPVEQVGTHWLYYIPPR